MGQAECAQCSGGSSGQGPPMASATTRCDECHVRRSTGAPQIHTGRGQGRTPEINDFNREWLRSSRAEEGGERTL